MSTPEAPPLELGQVERLAGALDRWARRHPFPNRPVVAFGGGPALSPRTLADRVRAQALGDRNEDAERFLRLVRFGVEVAPFEEILAQFTGSEG